MVNTCELLINIVISKQAKDAERLEPKGKGIGVEIVNFSTVDVTPSVNRQNLTTHVTQTEQGKPQYLLVAGR